MKAGNERSVNEDTRWRWYPRSMIPVMPWAAYNLTSYDGNLQTPQAAVDVVLSNGLEFYLVGVLAVLVVTLIGQKRGTYKGG
ncbi:MAG: hypothetical protein RBS22_13250 [Spongiibacteraceae bacterium]|nr:hypothetical protein [Spongiibacteraceae bacterium]